jgi:predicted transcriptional regulator
MSENKQQIASRVIEGAGLATVTASAFGQWVASNHDLIWSVGVIGGFILTLIGVASNIFFSYKKNQREAALHAIEVARITRAAGLKKK